MEISASRREGYTHDLVIGEHSLIADEPEEKGGSDLGPSPTALLAGSLAACTAITVEMYADRKGWELPKLKVSVEFEGSYVKGDASYEVILHLPGGLTEERVLRVQGLASSQPFNRDDPADPQNRRISIIVMNRDAEDRFYRPTADMVSTAPTDDEPVIRPGLATLVSSPARSSR